MEKRTFVRENGNMTSEEIIRRINQLLTQANKRQLDLILRMIQVVLK